MSGKNRVEDNGSEHKRVGRVNRVTRNRNEKFIDLLFRNLNNEYRVSSRKLYKSESLRVERMRRRRLKVTRIFPISREVIIGYLAEILILLELKETVEECAQMATGVVMVIYQVR